MKKTLMYLVAMFAFASVAGAQGWFRQPTPNDTLRSTVILPDNSVVFQIYAPEAKSVAVAGDLPWDKPAKFVVILLGLFVCCLSDPRDISKPAILMSRLSPCVLNRMSDCEYAADVIVSAASRVMIRFMSI